MKKLMRPIVQIVLNILFIPTYFIKFFHDIGVFPNGTKDYYYSPIDNLKSLDLIFLAYLSFVLIFGSFTLSIIELKVKNKKLALVSKILFALSILVFVTAIIISSTVCRGY